MIRNKDFLFTSESVSEGHPDKVCDRISDSILDLYIAADPESRVAVETLVTTNLAIVSGEIRSTGNITKESIEETIRNSVKDIGYEQDGFNWKTLETKILLHEQSADIAMGVDSDGNAKEEGAGDQGIMFGFACNETPEFMPAPILYSHKILKKLADKRHSGLIEGILPDSKSQVTLKYKDNKPKYIDSIVVSSQHTEDCSQERIQEIVRDIIQEVMPEEWLNENTSYIVNPTGKFVIGGPVGDTGLTGRKIIVDTYGGAAPHGGGAFSGKDPTKVDRSAAYAARYLAKNVVASKVATKCTIQLSYAIGVAKPLSIYCDTHGTGLVDESKIEKIIGEVMDLTPTGIRDHLNLASPIYERTSAYGHFGRLPTEDGGFSWEKTDLIEAIKNNV